ncbi:M20/M25/M40 family metallo-hydrolase [Roseomonas sp. AR75]|uniref:M20/M25/M40 family metallo-hydrolase n=1 Tax=Roseomonas sp. AR75 TaxID=2562311 RepID=UPI0014855C0F|nr:M20/M25/M40 family metallo-hydrolase [Roseomonas sp. AR75]
MPDASLRRSAEAWLAERQDAHVARIRDFVREPSVSPERRGLEGAAAFVLDALRGCGCDEAAILDLKDGFPGVWGKLDVGAAETLLIYGHYDVRPAGPERWTRDPFGAEIGTAGDFPQVVFGRGAATKGPLLAFLNAVQALHGLRRLPVNLVFLIEGAEILGSPNFPALAAAHQADLDRCTAIYGPRATQDAQGRVLVTLGYKGLALFELVARGTAWGRGPQGAALHSASQAAVDSPAWRLIEALACLGGTAGPRVPALQQALAARKPIAAWEEPLLGAIAARMAKAGPDAVLPGLSPQAKVARFRDGAEGRALLEDYLYGPSFNISGLRAGYTGPGSRTFLLPEEATATIDMRVISEVPGTQLLQMIRAHLDAQGFADIAIETACAYDWNQTAIDAGLVRATLETLAAHGCEATIWPMQPFGGPWAHYARTLGIPTLFGAAPGHGARATASDEYFVLQGTEAVAGLLGLELYFVDLLQAVAETGAA